MSKKNQKETVGTNGKRMMVHLYLKSGILARIDKQAQSESTIQPVHRTQMIRVLIERGLAAQKETA